MKPETEEERAMRLELEGICRDIGHEFAHKIVKATAALNRKAKVGFVLSLFDFGQDGAVAYISNANRADMIRMLQEVIEELKAN